MSATVDFRDVAATLHGSILEQHQLDIGANRFELTAVKRDGKAGGALSLAFEDLTVFRWHSKPEAAIAGGSARSLAGNPSLEPVIAGLERLGPGEPWRLYLALTDGGELELTCGRIISGGEEVTGIGRSYRK